LTALDDEKAARFLSSMLNQNNTVKLSELVALISGKSILVCGNAQRLSNELSEIDLSAFVILGS